MRMGSGVCRWFAWLCLLAVALPAQAKTLSYKIDQHYATIEFTTSGLFATQGYFRKFSGYLALDFQRPEDNSIDVTLDDKAIAMSWPPGVQMLESPAYFDAQEFPQIRFRSLSVMPADTPGQYEIMGALTIRGVTRPQMMLATLLSAPPGSRNAGTADVYVTGTLRRSAFGMVADQGTVNDDVMLKIHARVMLAK